MAPRKAKSPPPVSGSVRTPRSTRKSAAAQAATAGEGTPSSKGLFKLSGRPALPVEHKNDMLGPKGKVYQVKEQTLTLEHPAPAERIVIFRQKVPTPKGVSGHLIRRTDTDAVSASSLFRSAFPYASTEDENAEMVYIASKYDTVKAGREDEPEGAGRLTGVWVPLADASDLTTAYGLGKFAVDLLTYETENPLPVSPRLTDKTTGGSSNNLGLVPSSSEPQLPESPQPTRASKRTRVRSPAPAHPAPLPDVGATLVETRVEEQSSQEEPDAVQSVTVEQDVVADEATGETVERIQVTAPTQASPEEQIKASQALVEQLKAERVLADGNPLGESTNKKRSREIVEKDEEAENLPVVTRPTKRSWFGRTRRAATPASASVENERSGAARLLGFAALTAAGAAAVVAPYIFN